MSKPKAGTAGTKKLGYSSQLAFVISLIAGSVGTGNIWRFPRVAAKNGGAFMLCYILIAFAVIIPIMFGEHVMGRATRHGAPGAYRDFIGRKYTWMGTVVSMIMVMCTAYYSVVLAWVVHYIGLAATKGYYNTDKEALFKSVSNGNGITMLLFVGIVLISAYVAYKGVSGIEKANKIFIPTLFICLVITAIRSLTLPGASVGLNYLFSFKAADLLNGKIWLEALTQAIWSAGPGWGLVITLAVFSNPRSDVALTSTVNAMGDTFAALLAGLAVIPALFALSPSPQAALDICSQGNNGLTFLSMTSLFENMPGGYLIGILFFVSLLMAGLSSNIVQFVIFCLPFGDAGKNKKKVIICMALVMLVWGAPSAWNATFLSNQDWVVGQMMVVGSMFSCFAAIKFGTKRIREVYLNNKYSCMKVGKWWEICIKFIAPAITAIMFVWWCIQSLGWDSNWWNPLGISNLGTFIFQGGLMALICFLFNNKVADSVKDQYFKDDGKFPEIPNNGYSA